MKKLISNINFLTQKFRATLIIVVFLQIFVTFAEVLSIGSLFPLINTMLDEGKFLNYLDQLQNNFQFISETNKYFFVKNSVLLFGILIIFIFLLKNIICLFVNWYQSSFALNLKYQLSDKLFSNYLAMPHKFYLENNTANLLRNIGLINYSSAIIEEVLKITTEILVIVTLSIFLIIISPSATISILILFSFIFITIYILTKGKLKKWGNLIKETEATRIKHLKDGFELNREIKITNSQNYFLNNYLKQIDIQNKAMFKSKILSFGTKYLVELMVVISVIIFVYSIFYNSLNLNLNLPILAVIGAIGLRLFPSLNRIISSTQFIRTYYSMMSKLTEELLNTSEEKNFFMKNIKKKIIKKSITLENINQKFHDKNFEIKNLNISFNVNKPTFIYGPSGSGKTTLLNIILGFIKPKNGKILIDDIAAEENTINGIFLSVGFVPQEIQIFEDTILRNILMGRKKESISQSFLNKILDITLLNDFIKDLPYGIETVLGEKGLNISGGQRQRIGLARALINDPKIIVFDEATNSLDKKSEQVIIKNMLEFSKNKIFIIVSHNTESLSEEFNPIKIIEGKIV